MCVLTDSLCVHFQKNYFYLPVGIVYALPNNVYCRFKSIFMLSLPMTTIHWHVVAGIMLGGREYYKYLHTYACVLHLVLMISCSYVSLQSFKDVFPLRKWPFVEHQYHLDGLWGPAYPENFLQREYTDWKRPISKDMAGHTSGHSSKMRLNEAETKRCCY
jgi:hypothetical protein